MASNKDLNKANKAKKDEFYTMLADIEVELKHYRKHFKGKTVLCNCDDPFESNFFKYFAMNFNYLGLKKLKAVEVLKAQKEKTDDEYVFPSPNGGPISPDSVNNMLHRVLDRAGIPRVRFHDMRHPYVKYTTKINLRRQNLRQSYTGLPEISLAFLTENTFIQWFEAQSIQNPFPPSL